MQIVLVCALPGEVAQDVTDTVVGVHRLHTPDLLEALAERRIIQARLTSHEAFAQAEVNRRQPREMLGENLFQTRRIGGRAGDGVDADVEDSTDQELGCAAAERHHQSASGLKPEMICQSTHPELVI